MPRATTAAWLVMPPRVVRMPLAACMPWMSSGLVSMRTRMTASPLAARALGLVGAEHDGAGGGARARGQALGKHVRGAFGSSVGCSSWSSEAGLTRWIASASVDQPVLRHVDRDPQRAAAVRLPLRVCSM